MTDPRSITVLTTPEDADYYKSVLGDDADYRFNLSETEPLEDFLANVTISGGSIVVIDENHCLSPNTMAAGIRAYLDDPAWGRRGLRIIVACPRRKPGDHLLSYLTTYCGIYDIIYGNGGPHISNELARLIERPNARCDVLELLESPRLPASSTEAPSCVSASSIEIGPGEEICIRISFERRKKGQ